MKSQPLKIFNVWCVFENHLLPGNKHVHTWLAGVFDNRKSAELCALKISRKKRPEETNFKGVSVFRRRVQK